MILFTSVTCTSCKAVKKYIEDNKLEIEVADIFEDPRALNYPSIRSVPALVLEDKSVFMGAGVITAYLKGTQA